MTKFKSIILLGPGTEMFPMISKQYPKFSLPLINTTLLAHNINWLRPVSSEIIIIGLKKHTRLINEIIKECYAAIPIEFIPISQFEGSVSPLLGIRHRIDSSNVIVTKGDIISEIPASDIVRAFREKDCVCMSIFGETNSSNCITGHDNDKIYFYTSNSEESFDIPASFLREHQQMDLTRKLDTMQFYIFEGRLLDLVNIEIFSFKSNLFPFFVSHLRKINPVRMYRPQEGRILQIKNCDDYFSGCQLLKLTQDFELWTENATSQHTEYKNIIKPGVKKRASFEDVNGKSRNIVGSEFTINDAFIINTIVGNHCFIENGTAIIDSIIMNNVKIGANCKIEKCIIGNGVFIGDNSVLIDCRVSHEYKIDKDVVAKSKSFSAIDF
ncbi:putative translation initiation factor eIF-2B subunit gamma [Astathelohania contejeani]|uniref:Translation initiation factor eIF2B subunit gamma n=1 Tax=Astathelohania contejeani TaxID=164912 RepID=A0ABQ7HZT7_9MICR|nr:putative translation initiation factor eIF-2B subunit gamma [Thelohania contejeani]